MPGEGGGWPKPSTQNTPCALRQSTETGQITCYLLCALGANGYRHERRGARRELQHARGAGRPNVLRHLQGRLGRSGQGCEAEGGSRLQASGCVWPCGLGCGPRTLDSMPPNRNLE